MHSDQSGCLRYVHLNTWKQYDPAVSENCCGCRCPCSVRGILRGYWMFSIISAYPLSSSPVVTCEKWAVLHIHPSTVYITNVLPDVWFPFFFSLVCTGEIFELKAELNSDKKEKKKEAVKKVIASMTVGKDVRWARDSQRHRNWNN